MLRFKLKELLAEKSFQEDRRITMVEVSEKTGINRITLSKMANQKGYSTVTDNLDKLCAYFDCTLSDLAEYIPVAVQDNQ
ncbi:helix-turn-helix domain-containing protein [Marinomonas primoryensis]|jgi:DNA-binding Xre family transcriptional regulator|uniref:XRE family DNA-binding transcriptional regulator n=1 Tax=Marinomonas primoryensis TaxID=178399 RepID=A0A859CV38_9GAMM|nr:helix-turn-helix transcriptional regulator [Marinomonas primoryensis]QKK80375.1 XRE family DNA-binding transcriptional regulator [Marinomonas primoryensis]